MPLRINDKVWVLIGALAAGLLVACSPKAKPTNEKQAISAPLARVPAAQPNVNEFSEDQTLVAVSSALRRAGLLKRADLCFAYRFDPAPKQSSALVDVRENHEHAECGGDRATQPHLFYVRVDKQTKAMVDDAHEPGRFEPLQP